MRDELYRMCTTVLREIECPTVKAGGTEDHIHILSGLSRKIAIKDLIEHVKTETSPWIKKKDPSLRNFYWQGGYGAFSVGESDVGSVRDYIANQEEHHRRLSFQDEFRQLCQRHGLEIDERYAWD